MMGLQSGDTGRNVEVWQRFLARVWAGEAGAMMPGVFDDGTETATRAFQERHGIEPSGLVDRDTVERAALLGLDLDDALVPKGLSWSTGFAIVAVVVAMGVLSHCMLAPGGMPARSACPGWFC